MLIAALGMNHRSAPVEVRERVAFPPCSARPFLRRLIDDGVVSEAVLISTCNRTEIYAVAEDESARLRILDALADDRNADVTSLQEDTYWLTDAEAVRHLYRVASSLDSMVVGEGQILGQVRDAYRAATEERSAGPILNRLFHTSLRIGKDVRSQTGIGDSSLSIPHVAAKLAGEVFGTLQDKTALVLGAGGMSELVVEHLKDRGVTDLRIANRTSDRAAKLAEVVGGQAVAFEDIPDQLEEVDVVVSSTGSEDWVIRREIVERAMRHRSRPLFFVDIAVPRDVDPVVQNVEGVYLYDMDDLQAVVERNAGDRRFAAEQGEKLMAPAVTAYMAWISTLHVVPMIQELRGEAERIRHHELSRSLKRLDLSPEEADALEKMSHSLVNKLLHGPIAEMKARAEAGSPLDGAEVRRRLHALENIEVELHRSSPERP